MVPQTTNALARIVIVSPRRRLELALPEHLPLVNSLHLILRHAEEEAPGSGVQGGWTLYRSDGTALEPGRTLAAQNVLDGEVLHLVPTQTQWPELEYDDVVEAIADGARRRGLAWNARATRRTGLASAGTVLMAGLGTVLFSGPPWTAGGYAALAVATVLLLSGAALARAFGDSTAGAALAKDFEAKAIRVVGDGELDFDIEPAKKSFKAGEPIRFRVKGNRSYFLYLFSIDEKNDEAVLILPNQVDDQNRYPADRTLVAPNPAVEFVSDGPGTERLVVVASTKWLELKTGDYKPKGSFFASSSKDLDTQLKAIRVREPDSDDDTGIEASDTVVVQELALVIAEEPLQRCGCAVPETDPHHVRRRTLQQDALGEVLALRHDGVAVLAGAGPKSQIICPLEPHRADVGAPRKQRIEWSHQVVREVLVEDQLHAAEGREIFFSSSAAKAREARMSSRSRSGKSWTICSSLMPSERMRSREARLRFALLLRSAWANSS